MNRKFSYPPLTTRTLYHSKMLTNDVARRILRKRVLAPLPRRRILVSKVNSIVRPHQTHFKNERQYASNYRDKQLGRENVSRMPQWSTENKRQLYNTGSGHRELKRPLSHSIHVFNERKSVLSVGQFKDNSKQHSITINTKDHRHSNPASPNIQLNDSARQIYRTRHVDSLRSNKALLRRRYLLTSHNRVVANNRRNVSLRSIAASNKLNYLDDKDEIAENPSSSLSQKDKYSSTTGRSPFLILPINQNDENPPETTMYHKRSSIPHKSGNQRSRNSALAHRYSYNHGYSSNNERECRYDKEISTNSNTANSQINQLIPSHRQAPNSRAYVNRKAYVARRILRKTVLALPLRKRILVPRVRSNVPPHETQINDETRKHCLSNYRSKLPRREYISRLPLTSIDDGRQQGKIHGSQSGEQLTTSADYSFRALTDAQHPHSFRSSEHCRRQCKDNKPHISSRQTMHASRRSTTDSTFKPRIKSSHCTASTYANTSESQNIIDSKSFSSPTIDDISEAVNLTLMPPPQPFSPVKEALVVTKNNQLTALHSNKISDKNEKLTSTDKQEIGNTRNLKPFIGQIHNLRSIPHRFKQIHYKKHPDRIEYDTNESNLNSFERSKRANGADATIKRDQFSSDLRQHAADRRLVKPTKHLMNSTAHRRYSSSQHLPPPSSIDHKSSESFNFSKQLRQNSDKCSNQKIPLDKRHHSSFHGRNTRSPLFAHLSNPNRKTLVDNYRNHHASEQRHSIAYRSPYDPDNRQSSTIGTQRQMFEVNRQLQEGHPNRSASNMKPKINDLLSRYGRRKPHHFDCRFKGRR